jgi:hypothetical protein
LKAEAVCSSEVLTLTRTTWCNIPEDGIANIGLEHLDKSAIAEHSIDHGHCIQFHNSSIHAMKTRYMDCVLRDAIEIELHPYIINREHGFYLSRDTIEVNSTLQYQ